MTSAIPMAIWYVTVMEIISRIVGADSTGEED